MLTTLFALVLLFTPLNQAMEKSKKDGKPILVEFYADWCIPCKQMEKTVFKDKRVLNELKNFHFVRIDTESKDDIPCEGEKLPVMDCMMIWDLGGIPAFAIITPMGQLKHLAEGTYDTEDFLKLLNQMKKAQTL